MLVLSAEDLIKIVISTELITATIAATVKEEKGIVISTELTTVILQWEKATSSLVCTFVGNPNSGSLYSFKLELKHDPTIMATMLGLVIRHRYFKYNRGTSAEVVHQGTTKLPVGRKVYSIMGIPTHTMTNDQIQKKLVAATELPCLLPTKEECLAVNGFYVCNRRLAQCVVTDSSRDDVPNKAIVVCIGNLTCTDSTAIDDVIFKLGTPGIHVEVQTADAIARSQCLVHSGIYASRVNAKDKNSLLVVTEANDPRNLGKQLWDPTGAQPLKLTQTQIHRMLQSSNSKSQFTLRGPPTVRSFTILIKPLRYITC
jgi:hypothetical protein